MSRLTLRPTLAILLLLLTTACRESAPAPAAAGELSIAAAASLRPVVEELMAVWGEQPGAIPVRATYGASGVLFAQIDSKAPFDLFLSADDVYPRRVHDRGRGEKPFQFAAGRLAVWVPEGVPALQSLPEIADPRFEKIAIASPNLAPYGEAALEALELCGSYDVVKDRLLFGGNVMEAAHYAQSGGADAAILSLSLVRSSELASRGTFLVVPAELHDPIQHEGVVISDTADIEAAKQFVELLRGPVGAELLVRFGFELPEGTGGSGSGRDSSTPAANIAAPGIPGQP